jgi:hypothetical protein
VTEYERPTLSHCPTLSLWDAVGQRLKRGSYT